MAPNGQPYPLDAGGQSISTAKTFITKVKNFRIDAGGALVSFDAQFKFWYLGGP